MGNSACKSACNSFENGDKPHYKSSPPQSQYDDEEEKGGIKPIPLEEVSPLKKERPVSPKAKEEPIVTAEPVLPQRSGKSSETSPKVRKAESEAKVAKGATSRSEPMSPAHTEPGSISLKFELPKDCKSYQAQFTEVRNPVGTDNPGILVITEVADESPLIKTVDGRPGLCPGDTLMEVNSTSGAPKTILEALTKAKTSGGILNLKVRPRPATFIVRLKRLNENDKVGFVAAVHVDNPRKVEVRKVSAIGAIARWSEKNYQEIVVSGDWIVAVNGKAMPSSDLITCMQEEWSEDADLTLSIESAPTIEARLKPMS